MEGAVCSPDWKGGIEEEGMGRGVSRGKGEKFLLPKPIKCCRKMMLFPKALFLITDFQLNS